MEMLAASTLPKIRLLLLALVINTSIARLLFSDVTETAIKLTYIMQK